MKTLTILAICLIASTAFAANPNLVSIFESDGATYIITPDNPRPQLVLESVKTDNNQPVKTDSNFAKKIMKHLKPDAVDFLNFFWLEHILD